MRSVAGVAEARVYGKSSSLAGQLVACDIVAQGNPDVVLALVREACLARLTAYQRPRTLRLVQQIALSEAGKVVRGEPIS